MFRYEQNKASPYLQGIVANVTQHSVRPWPLSDIEIGQLCFAMRSVEHEVLYERLGLLAYARYQHCLLQPTYTSVDEIYQHIELTRNRESAQAAQPLAVKEIAQSGATFGENAEIIIMQYTRCILAHLPEGDENTKENIYGAWVLAVKYFYEPGSHITNSILGLLVRIAAKDLARYASQVFSKIQFTLPTDTEFAPFLAIITDTELSAAEQQQGLVQCYSAYNIDCKYRNIVNGVCKHQQYLQRELQKIIATLDDYDDQAKYQANGTQALTDQDSIREKYGEKSKFYSTLKKLNKIQELYDVLCDVSSPLVKDRVESFAFEARKQETIDILSAHRDTDGRRFLGKMGYLILDFFNFISCGKLQAIFRYKDKFFPWNSRSETMRANFLTCAQEALQAIQSSPQPSSAAGY